jgi:hypothetical protein
VCFPEKTQRRPSRTLCYKALRDVECACPHHLPLVAFSSLKFNEVVPFSSLNLNEGVTFSFLTLYEVATFSPLNLNEAVTFSSLNLYEVVTFCEAHDGSYLQSLLLRDRAGGVL